MFGGNLKSLFKFLGEILDKYFPRKRAKKLVEKIVVAIIAYSFIWLLLGHLHNVEISIMIKV